MNLNLSKLTLASFLAQAAFFSLVRTNKALCSATVLEEEEVLQDGDFSNKNSNLRGNKFQSSNRILSSDSLRGNRWEPDELLRKCEGDCDSDTDCINGLVCYHRDGFTSVPGCKGLGNDSFDYCIEHDDYDDTILQGDSWEPVNKPLRKCEGDCDSDTDCINDLVCYQRDDFTSVPGCKGLGNVGFDYCIEHDDYDPVWPDDFKWSYDGEPNGYDCISIYENAEPYSNGWHNNFFCWKKGRKDPNMRWSQNDPIANMRCTKIHERNDPHAWTDNYLCVPEMSSLYLGWSEEGRITGLECINWNEPDETASWHDNFLCGHTLNNISNIALRKPSSLSTPYVSDRWPAPAPAFNAVDGNRYGSHNRGTLAISGTGIDQWLQVDLAPSNELYDIKMIRVWNRGESRLWHQLHNYKIDVLDHFGNVSWTSGIQKDAPQPDKVFVLPDGVFGSRVKLYHVGEGWIILSELEVYS